MTEAQKRAAGYVRVSTAAQAHEGESLQTQRDSIALHCQRHGPDLMDLGFRQAGDLGRFLGG